MVEGFREVRRVLRKDGTLWLNLGDTYAHGIPHGPVVDNTNRCRNRQRGRHRQGERVRLNDRCTLSPRTSAASPGW